VAVAGPSRHDAGGGRRGAGAGRAAPRGHRGGGGAGRDRHRARARPRHRAVSVAAGARRSAVLPPSSGARWHPPAPREELGAQPARARRSTVPDWSRGWGATAGMVGLWMTAGRADDWSGSAARPAACVRAAPPRAAAVAGRAAARRVGDAGGRGGGDAPSHLWLRASRRLWGCPSRPRGRPTACPPRTTRRARWRPSVEWQCPTGR